MDLDRCLALEQAVVAAWPAAEAEPLGPWLLRASGGPAYRGNSVATANLAPPEGDLGALVDRVEAWYRARGRRPMLQIGPCTTPALDPLLEARGYTKEGAALTETAHAEQVREGVVGTLETVVERAPSEAFLEVAGRTSRFRASYDVFLGLLARLGKQARFVSARDTTGHTVATCLCVVGRAHVGIHAMFTREGERRRGAAASMLVAASRLADVEARGELYLQVETTNEGARRLYERAGFRTAYPYHYRALP